MLITPTLVLAAALTPAAATLWMGRAALRRIDDAAFPEILLAQRQRLTNIRLAAAALVLITGGEQSTWAIPLLIAGVVAARYPLRRALFDETWSVAAYLRYSLFSLIGGAGFWLFAAMAPAIVLAIVDAWMPGDFSARASRLATTLGALSGAAIWFWQSRYPSLWLHLHRATRFDELRSPELAARLEGVLERSGAALHRRPVTYRFGAPGGWVMNAVALPSLGEPAVALGDTLLATLTESEIVAVYAHEIAHHEHYDARRLRRARAAGALVALISAVLPALLLSTFGAAAQTVALAYPLLLALGVGRRLAKRRQHETESDQRAVALTGDAPALASALQKLHVLSRVPRRWPHGFERAASHPSLARRVQAILGDAPPAALDGPTQVRARDAAVVVVLDAQRAHWLHGVPGDVPLPLDLATLQNLASSYRAVAYADLTELRVAVEGDERVLMAGNHAGERWTVPLRAEDIASVQATLDQVDVRLGHVGAASTFTARPAARALAAVLFFTLAIAGQFGLVLVPIVGTLVRPTTSLMAATGAMALGLASVAASGATTSITWGGVAGSFAAALWLLVIAIKAARASAKLQGQRRPQVETRLEQATLLALGAAAAMFGAVVGPQALAAPRTLLADAAAVSLATVLVGIGAALATFPVRHWRRFGWGLLVVGAGTGVASSGGSVLLDRSTALTWVPGDARLIATVAVGGNPVQLVLSPDAAHYAVRSMSPAKRGTPGLLDFTVGRFSSDSSSRAATRRVQAEALAFVDAGAMLVLEHADSSATVLRLERIEPSGTGDTLARWTLPALESPQLTVDPTRHAWSVAGRSQSDDELMVRAGRIGSDSVLAYHFADGGDPLGVATTRVLASFEDGSVLSFAPQGWTSSASAWLQLITRFGPRWNTWRTGSTGRRLVSEITGYSACASSRATDAVICVDRDTRRSRVWRVASTGQSRLLLTLPPSFFVAEAEGGSGSGLAVASRDGSERALIDLATRRAVRVPKEPAARTPSRFVVAVAAAGDHLASLSTQYGKGSTLSLYRVR